MLFLLILNHFCLKSQTLKKEEIIVIEHSKNLFAKTKFNLKFMGILHVCHQLFTKMGKIAV